VDGEQAPAWPIPVQGLWWICLSAIYVLAKVAHDSGLWPERPGPLPEYVAAVKVLLDALADRPFQPPKPSQPLRAYQEIISNKDLPAYLCCGALEAISASGQGDVEFLRQLTCTQEEAFAPEVLAIGAVCALSRCRHRQALLALAQVVEQGQEALAFQAASHLTFIVGLRVPPLIQKGSLVGDIQWADINRIFVDPKEWRPLASDLRQQIQELPDNWWQEPERLGLFAHRHLDLRWHRVQEEARVVPDLVLKRSQSEDLLWRPAPAGP
jgi:hypothetical protein